MAARHPHDEPGAGMHDDPRRLPIHVARDLHDTVIQRLFATGLILQRTVGLVPHDPEAAAARIEGAIDELDETVRQIRATVLGHLGHPGARRTVDAGKEDLRP
jgi:signal transduction histidine kinase